MESFGKGNGQTSAFKPDANNRVSKPLPPRPSSTPPPLNRPQTVPNTPIKTSHVVVAGPVPAPPAAHAAPRPSDDAYGIRRAIELLRRLPAGERAVLVEVVRMT